MLITWHRCIAYGVGFMNGMAGLEAWRWLFIVEGVPSSTKDQPIPRLTYVVTDKMDSHLRNPRLFVPS